MTDGFRKNVEIPLIGGLGAVVRKKLGEGGQGAVYQVAVGEKDYALKWYHRGVLGEPERFYRNLENNLAGGAPTDAFLWPLYLTERKDGSFGYVMKLREGRYRDFSDFLLARVRFRSISAAVRACLNIANGFRQLHRRGFSYQDINDGNFFIDPREGDALICDNDNVAPFGDSLGIAGKARYMAPEVVRNMKRPDIHSDRFSLAVVLFRILFLDHPLEGKRVLVPCLTEELELKFYGKDPLFIYDPANDGNRPVRGVHGNVIRFWQLYPAAVRHKFTEAFSAEAMHGGAARVTGSEWQILFTRLRDMLIVCPCGGETFAEPGEESSLCIHCGVKIPRPPVLFQGKYAVTLFPGRKIYRCHVDADSDDYAEIAGEVVRNPGDPRIWGLKNLSGSCWTMISEKGVVRAVPPGEVARIARARTLDFGSAAAEIR